MAKNSNEIDAVLLIVRMQCFGKSILAEDVHGRHFMMHAADTGPVRQVVYLNHYPSGSLH